jgi:hypothetical protein
VVAAVGAAARGFHDGATLQCRLTWTPSAVKTACQIVVDTEVSFPTTLLIRTAFLNVEQVNY